MRRRALVLAPHPDDETIGVGGTIGSLRSDRHDVDVVFVTSGSTSVRSDEMRKTEARQACEELGVGHVEFWDLPTWCLDPTELHQRLQRAVVDQAPDVVICPHPGERDTLHSLVGLSVVGLIDLTATTQQFLGYEVWTPLSDVHRLVDVTAWISGKRRALACYGSQLRARRYDEAVLGLNRYRAIMNDCGQWAEAFSDLKRRSRP